MSPRSKLFFPAIRAESGMLRNLIIKHVPKGIFVIPQSAPKFQIWDIVVKKNENQGEKIGFFDLDFHQIRYNGTEVPTWIWHIARKLEERFGIQYTIYFYVK